MQIIKHSVSQGALHCPKLFIRYINHMCNMTKLINIILFYGETNIFCSASEVNQLGNICYCKVQLLLSINQLAKVGFVLVLHK